MPPANVGRNVPSDLVKRQLKQAVDAVLRFAFGIHQGPRQPFQLTSLLARSAPNRKPDRRRRLSLLTIVSIRLPREILTESAGPRWILDLAATKSVSFIR